MAAYPPITLEVLDENGNILFSQSVPFEWEIDVKQVMERAFVLSQSSATPDPLVYTVQYYGYSKTPQFPGYMGYEIESIQDKPNNQKFYWQLLIDGVPAQEGADSEQPQPGSTVTWQYTLVPQKIETLSIRSRLIHARRFARHDS